MELLALVTVFAAIVCLVLALGWRQQNPMDSRLAVVRGERPMFDTGGRPGPESATSRLLLPFADAIGGRLESLLPSRWVRGVEQKLVQAGQPATVTGYLMAFALSVTFGVAMGFVLVASMDSSGIKAMMTGGGCVVGGFLLPRMWLSNRVKARQKAILKSLPDAFDLVTTCVEAGLGLEAALAKVAEKVEGPFGEELMVALREVSMGKLRRDALREMANRTGVPDLTTFINAVVQAETMGTSIATVLRVQADQMRTKRRQRAEQAAHQAPVKMIFPLVLCIFPTLFIVILGPAGITISETLGGTGK